MKSNLQIGSEVFLSALEQTPASIVITDVNGEIVYVNKFFTELTGYTFEEALGKNPRILKSGYQSDEFYRKLWKTIISGKIWKGELLNKKKDGTLYWEKATIKPITDKDGKITNYLAVKQDVTEEKKRTSKARRRERILNDIERLSKTGGWEYDPLKDEFYWSDQLYEIHGLSKPFDLNHVEKSFECYHPGDRERIRKAFERCLKEGKDYDYTVRFTDFKGNQKWVRTKSHALKDEEENIVKIIGSVRDVTEEVEREKSLKESHGKFKTLVQSFDDIVFTLDRRGRHTALYGTWADDEVQNELLGKNSFDIFGEEKGEIHMKAVQEALKGVPVVYEWEFENAEGETEYYQTKLTLLNDKPEDTVILGVARNVTIETVYQQELFETKKRLELALEATRAGTWDWDLTNDKMIVNEWWAKMLGYSLSEIEPHISSWENLTHPSDLKPTKELLFKLFTGEEKYFETQIRMQHKDGSWIWINDRGVVAERDEEGQPIRLAGTHVDITERVKTQEALKLSEKRYRDLFTRSSEPNLIFKKGVIIDCNTSAVEILGYEKKNELIGKTVVDISPKTQPDGTLSADLQREMLSDVKEKKSLRFEWCHQKKGGSNLPVEVVITAFTDTNEEDLLHVVWRDITNRKKAEKQVLASLQEKEALLSEIHHRVKNNLAVISGLLQLQIYQVEDDSLADVLNSSINRVKSMALIHEQLYQSENFSDISLKENILKQAESTRDVFMTEDSPSIELNLDLEDISIGINQAMPVGLLVNEILINGFKHAFKGKEKGQISVELFEEECCIHLNISDNGIGFDSSGEESNTLGTTLIKTFAGQLEAEMEMDSSEGTSYRIKFERSDHKGSVVSQRV
ncbi:PAS domain S-box protein [Rhodohalobacter sp.]|uniref:PAS domain S-box protein n=1 Tax=Rhodohalobacter sp. TaxID=1974210 RepID=UPI003568DBE7